MICKVLGLYVSVCIPRLVAIHPPHKSESDTSLYYMVNHASKVDE